jgi:hypothetical protein
MDALPPGIAVKADVTPFALEGGPIRFCLCQSPVSKTFYNSGIIVIGLKYSYKIKMLTVTEMMKDD